MEAAAVTTTSVSTETTLGAESSTEKIRNTTVEAGIKPTVRLLIEYSCFNFNN